MDPKQDHSDPLHTPPSNGFVFPLPGSTSSGHNLSSQHNPFAPTPGKERNPTADLVRKKLLGIYATEPDAVSETVEASQAGPARSKHQQYMYDLSTSGKSLAEIQSAWHEYYSGLPDAEKHDVWQEFYAASETTRLNAAKAAAQAKDSAEQATVSPLGSPTSLPAVPQFELPGQGDGTFVRSYEAEMLPKQSESSHGSSYKRHGNNLARRIPGPHHAAAGTRRKPGTKKRTPPTVADVKRQLVGTVGTRAKLKPKHHLQSLAFGLATGSLVILVLMFGFFNERFIAPFITPSKNISATPLIVDEKAEVPKEPKMIIPKINVELPVIYDVPTIDDAQIEAGLEGGVVHYPTTPNPGEKGNAVFFGHSSSNILNNGKYKFAFVLLNRLENGDTFYIHKDGKRYVYKVFDRKIVKPTQVEVLNPIEGKTATATLITCDPPGTAVNRLVVFAEQISPDPNANAPSTALQTDQKPAELASDSPSLWSRFTNWIF